MRVQEIQAFRLMGKTMRSNNYLFSQIEWYSFEKKWQRDVLSEINGIDGNRLLNTSVEDLCNYFKQKYRLDVPVLHEDRSAVDQHEKEIDVSQDIGRDIRDRSRPFHIAGTCIEVTVPFTGDQLAFQIRPTGFMLSGEPPGCVQRDSLILSIEGVGMKPEQVKSQIQRTLGKIRNYLEWLQDDADNFNKQISQIVRGRIEARREKLLADQNLVSALGLPLKEHPGAPKTFLAPEVRRRIIPTMPHASNAPYQPEPILSVDDYEHILSVTSNMVLVMERSPSDFTSMNEDTLRSHFLIQLNGHYEGQATGETFNYEGKTDILVRVDGKNIFIAECKYWRGQKKFSDTIDQLLGYTSWRDTKTAILIFNRNKNFSKVLETIPATVKAHSNFKKEMKSETEGRFQYIFGHRDDANREMILTVLAFDVPQT